MEGRFSRGERTLFPQDNNSERDKGNAAFAKKDYSNATKFFKSAIEAHNNEPESQIYFNNAKALQRGKPYTVALVIPTTNQGEVAKELLRGAADAQTQFNQANSGAGNRLLELLLVNDGNVKQATSTPTQKRDDLSAQVAAQVACQIARDPEVLGVIGHNSSDASKAALPAYEAAKIAMVSPTATSILVKSPVFFRTVPSDQVSAPLLADYATAQKIDRVALFYAPASAYSKSLADSFAQAYKGNGGRVVAQVDIEKPNFNGEREVDAIAEKGVKAIVLFPSSGTRSIAFQIIKFNNALEGKKMRLLGGDTLYHPDTLIEGGGAIKDMVVIAPSLFTGTPYTDQAKQRWLGWVSWRTAGSFDATQAILATFKKKPVTRQSILSELPKIQIKEKNGKIPTTAGEPLQFDAKGDRMSSPLLVQTGLSNRRPKGAQFGFEPLTEKTNSSE
jgi:branched-chain amino acid transport system substrate-binding protein